MLKATLSGNYVSFGVFRLYGDDALENSLNTFVKLLLSIPQSDLLVSLGRRMQCIFLLGFLGVFDRGEKNVQWTDVFRL